MNKKTKFKYLVGVTLTAFIALVGLLTVLLTQADRVIALGLIGPIWYVLLIFLGLLCSISLFFLFNSYARYSGKALGGKLELGGPGVLMLVIVGLGFQLAPPSQTDFDFTLFITTDNNATPLVQQGRVTLDLGDDRRSVAIGAQGEARFTNIAGRFRDQPVRVALHDGFPYVLTGGSDSVTLQGESAYLKVQVQSVTLQGKVVSADGEAVAGSRVRVQDAVVISDAQGRFKLNLPADMAQSQRVIEASADGFVGWRGQFTLAAGELVIQLQNKTTQLQ
ncbi:MAG: carboxypeptidase-like regulatory domain-containing protein [Psychrosphaera sp.]|nr:carboxypeptidase-like regulatory domain-containing protein [Psychrosphaera sp.]